MVEVESCLHPNPGWEVSNKQEMPDKIDASTSSIFGKHCILELYHCDKQKLNDEAFLRTALTKASKQAGATLLNLVTHKFEPQGVTGLVLLAESHISVHTWPENGYAAVDVFTCGSHTMPEKACQVLYEQLAAQGYSLNSLKRANPIGLNNTLRNPNPVKF